MSAALAKVQKSAAEPAAVLPDVRARLAAAQKRLSGLLAEQGRLAEASVTNPESEQKYFETVDAIARVHGEIELCQKARESLEAKEAQQLKEQQSAAATELRGRTVALLDRRLEAAQTFEAAAIEMIKAMRSLVELSREAYQSFPGQQPPMIGLAVSNDELSGLVGGELYRLGGTAAVSGGNLDGPGVFALPPARAPTLAAAGQPSLVEPLTTAILNCNAYAKTLLQIGEQ